MSAVPTRWVNLYVLVVHGLYALKYKTKSKVCLRLKIMGFFCLFLFQCCSVCVFKLTNSRLVWFIFFIIFFRRSAGKHGGTSALWPFSSKVGLWTLPCDSMKE